MLTTAPLPWFGPRTQVHPATLYLERHIRSVQPSCWLRLSFSGQPQSSWKHLLHYRNKFIAALEREALIGMSPETLGLARHLLACEAIAGKGSEPTELPASRVYEKLRPPLCALAGVAGFRSLVSRALTMAREEAPGLSVVQVTPEGYLHGLGEIEPQIDHHQAGEGGVILIAQLLGLLHTFIGEGLTLRLVQDVWPDAAFDDGHSGNGEKRERTR